jgi:hypothetical protein
MSRAIRTALVVLACGVALTGGAALTGCAEPPRSPEGGAAANSRSPEAGATPGPSSGHPTDSTPAAPVPTAPTLIAFVQVGTGAAGDAAGEVTAPGRIDRFLVGPPPADQAVRDAVARHRTDGVRLFAFLLTGCQNDGASLAIEPPRVYATLTGGVGIQCLVAEQFLAVFAVPAGLVPAGAMIGSA